MSRHTIRIDDPDLEDYLTEADSKSEAVREALRARVADEEAATVDVGLTDTQRQGLDVLLAESFETRGRAAGELSKDVAESQLAQRLQIATDSVVRVVIRPLIDAGYVRLAGGKTALKVYREPRPEVGSTSRPASDWESPETSECVHTHLRDSTGTCLRCGDESPADADRETAADGSGEPVALAGEETECTGDGCNRMLAGNTETCFDCRGEADE
ncbi:hypothetical protein [Halorientalis regularis]|uniref:Uncharacterized protein n=1 Tax=Halorientalis regularis TaxID=660518 RepID=A0A1G7RG18_9EURY|nr:hypothetical protein [Halorientalis regularis]SDG09585.1 hypothetical protein SAMN05216218_11514 [Halorientalis regularis]